MLHMTNTTPHDGDVTPSDRQISVRIPLDILDRVDALMSHLERHPHFGAFALSRNGVIKLLLTKGLDELEAEYGPTLVPAVFENAIRVFASGLPVRRNPEAAWLEFLRQHGGEANTWLGQSEPVIREITRRYFDRAIERANRSAPDAGEAPDLSGVSTEDQPSDHEALRAFDPREGLKAFKSADPLTSRPGGRRE